MFCIVNNVKLLIKPFLTITDNIEIMSVVSDTALGISRFAFNHENMLLNRGEGEEKSVSIISSL